ncbi:MAG: neutral zinc metallopeptidase [Prevotella sp.]|nr:neutral zinc metallopeptidase [Prevotella sp.]MCF0207811.1 neutral zinc metallopeptidase [Bacteroidaceae bacterium]
MRLDGRRESSNVEDRRGMSGGAKAGIGGIGGVILIALVTFLGGGDIGDVFNAVQQNAAQQTATQGEYTPSAEEEELASFSKKILAGTEDVWTEIFKQSGRTYQPPKLVLFTNAVSSGCGNATASVGPFYCSADQTVYIDLSFFTSMQKQLGGGGDFAYAYVIAHEVGHHVQYLLGTLDEAHSQMSRLSQKEANKISVRLELQADFYAGIWAHYDNKKFASLEDGDIEEGLDIASKIGDDYLQKKAQGYEVPDAFNHGRSEWRVRWFKKGIMTGDLAQGDSFSPAYGDF